MRNQKVQWSSLAEIGFVFGAALVVEIRLPFSQGADSWLLILWVLLFYGAVGVWLSANGAALEREPRPVDCVGRPILDPDGAEVAETQETPIHRPLPPALSRPEVM